MHAQLKDKMEFWRSLIVETKLFCVAVIIVN